MARRRKAHSDTKNIHYLAEATVRRHRNEAGCISIVLISDQNLRLNWSCSSVGSTGTNVDVFLVLSSLAFFTCPATYPSDGGSQPSGPASVDRKLGIGGHAAETPIIWLERTEPGQHLCCVPFLLFFLHPCPAQARVIIKSKLNPVFIATCQGCLIMTSSWSTCG
jgi:hypothetical protein